MELKQLKQKVDESHKHVIDTIDAIDKNGTLADRLKGHNAVIGATTILIGAQREYIQALEKALHHKQLKTKQ